MVPTKLIFADVSIMSHFAEKWHKIHTCGQQACSKKSSVCINVTYRCWKKNVLPSSTISFSWETSRPPSLAQLSGMTFWVTVAFLMIADRSKSSHWSITNSSTGSAVSPRTVSQPRLHKYKITEWDMWNSNIICGLACHTLVLS